MKILKMCKIKHPYGNGYSYNCVFDNIPPVTYVEENGSYLGTACDENGRTVLFKKQGTTGFGGAYGGEGIDITMKDGTKKHLSDRYFSIYGLELPDNLICIGASTVERLQKCFVFSCQYIDKEIFFEMIQEYQKNDVMFDDYDEIERWVDSQKEEIEYDK